MSRRHLIGPIRARLDGERGFTILETVVAMVVIFGSLTALMYTATSGFRYIALARERQAATGAATRLMEQLRALSVDTITDGMKTSDIATGDPKIKTPSDCGDGAYHYLTCAGAKIVHESDPPTVQPLVPHTGTLSAPEYPTTYTWATYITNSDPTNDPYRLTVIVSWSGGAVGGAAKFVQLQSLWSSPKGCAASPVIHPFAGACQPFFTGTATASQGTVILGPTGSTTIVNGTPITSPNATLFGASAEARGSIEQVSQMQGAVGQSGASWSSTTRGLTSLATAADGNPSTGTLAYDPATGSPPATLVPSYGSPISVTGSPVAMSISAGSSGDSGSSVAADAANSSTTKCPSVSVVWPSSQNDVLPCAWARAVRGATLSGTVDTTKVLGSTPGSAGLLTLAQLTGTSTVDSWADRQVSAGTTGTLEMTAKRVLGTTELIGIPARFLATNVSGDTLTGASITTLFSLQSCTNNSNYVIRSTAGTATAIATTGISASNPSAAWSGADVKVYNGPASIQPCSSYGDATGLNASSAQQPPFTGFTLQRFIRVGGNQNCMTYQVSPVAAAPLLFGGVTTTKSPSVGTTLTDASATVNPIVTGQVNVRLIYETGQNSTCTSATAVTETLLDLTVTISVGSLTSRSQYTPAPTGGE
jgi:type II secretory pathway pseudopilin PulG